jgi:hypothetical protein
VTISRITWRAIAFGSTAAWLFIGTMISLAVSRA